MTGKTILLENDAIRVAVRVAADGATFLDYILPAGREPQPSCSPYHSDPSLPLIELRLSAEGNRAQKSSQALVASYIGERLRYRAHAETEDGAGASLTKTLDVELHDEKTGITATSHLTIFAGLPVLRATVTVKNDSPIDATLVQVPSVVIGGLTRSREWWHDYEVAYANNTWFREAQWVTRSLPDVGVDDYGIYGLPYREEASHATFSIRGRGTFSTQGKLPMGMLKRRDKSETWLWQVEHNGPWRWEIGDWHDNVYLAASGPTTMDHEWRHRLTPGASFTSVPVAVTHVYDDQDAGFAAITDYRRRIRRRHADNEKLPIIFNDYMNCLMGDPTDEKILALVAPVAKTGAEFFVIDAGWYADDGNWWSDVGLWEPSKRRFPMGFENLLNKIRDAGLTPGVWLEPEVIGVRSVMANRLPMECFFQRGGERLTEKGRHQLDFRHPLVCEHLDKVVDRCVQQYGVGYFKFDYNIHVTQGTDGLDSFSAGSGLLEHNRAYLAWVNKIFDRYPDLVIESCSSGAQRLDYAMLATHPLQSTSDQQYPHHYAAIAAGVATAVTPEQSASWAYPQPDWSDELNAMTVVNSLLGRVHLSGRLDLLNPEQFQLVLDGMNVYKKIRADIPTSKAFWPLGLPAWHDDWLALGLAARSADGKETGTYYVSVWRRGGGEKKSLSIPITGNRQEIKVEFLYPTQLPVQSSWDASQGVLNVELPAEMSARLFRVYI